MRHGAYWQICCYIALALSRGWAHEEAVEDDRNVNAGRDVGLCAGRCFAANRSSQARWCGWGRQGRQGDKCWKAAKVIATRLCQGVRWVENSPEEEGGFRYHQESRQTRTWWMECAGIGGGPTECRCNGGQPYKYRSGQNFSAEFEEFQASCCSLSRPSGGVECGATCVGGGWGRAVADSPEVPDALGSWGGQVRFRCPENGCRARHCETGPIPFGCQFNEGAVGQSETEFQDSRPDVVAGTCKNRSRRSAAAHAYRRRQQRRPACCYCVKRVSGMQLAF